MSEKKNKKRRLKLGSLPQKEAELAGQQAATIKGGGGNGGVNGGDYRSGAQVRSALSSIR